VAKIAPCDGDSYDRFGAHMALSGTTLLVVGAYDDADNYGSNAGAAYVFGQGAGWADGHANQLAKIPRRWGHGDQFGYRVAICGDTVVVGVNYDKGPNGYHSGSVYIFEKGAGWADGSANQAAKLYPEDGDGSDYLGGSVAIEGETVLTGAGGDDNANGTDAGSAYVFVKGAAGLTLVPTRRPSSWQTTGTRTTSSAARWPSVATPPCWGLHWIKTPNGYNGVSPHVFERSVVEYDVDVFLPFAFR
jgi:hypothetical protein